MSRKPVIGVTTWRRNLDTGELGDTFLDTNAHAYQRALAQCGAVPFLIPMTEKAASDAASYIAIADGILIPGGDDVEPDLYGGPPARPNLAHDRTRDLAEIAIAREARAAGKPLLGICKGLQITNVAMGGTLVDDIGTSDAHHEPIYRRIEQLKMRHRVTVDEDSRLGAIMGTEGLVNTLHHQAADEVGDGLRVVGRADDGVIEALESTSDWWFIGVQWHPEILYNDGDPRARALFESFLAACVPALVN